MRDILLRTFPRLKALPPGVLVVGGAIRDLLLGVQPGDVDLTCDDPKACAERIGGRVVTLGRDELTAFRVTFAGRVYDFAEATTLARRDFTINAMAVDLATGELLDPHGGRDDIREKVVRMIDPKNFDDDPLRTLRGVRMAVRYGFDIESRTVAAIRDRAARIADVAVERVTYELNAVFSAGAFRRAVELLHETALDVPLFGAALDASRFHADDVPLAAAYALVVRDARAHAERWRWSEATLRDVQTLQRLAEQHDALTLYEAGERVGHQLSPMLRALGRPDDVLPTDSIFETEPLLDGAQIAELAGLAPGPEVGERKRALIAAQLSGEVRTHAEAIAFVRAAMEPRSGDLPT